MDKESARRLIKDTFQNPFDKNRFIYFIKNILNRYDGSKTFRLHGCYIPDSFKDYIKSFERIGTYTDPEGKKIDILIVHLKRETTIDRARTAQRNFIARYLKERGEKDAGLVAFVSPQGEDWRFSFVKMEYKFKKTPKGDVKVKEEFTPARRYSFLVGKNESSHTAQSCFVDILINDIHNLKLNEIEEAFSIEKVTKEFFEKYRNLFFQVKDTLDEIVKKDEEIRKEFQQKGVNVVDFSKKLLGQTVFLYFLQKKGWFGVKEGQKWGTGSKHFLRELFEKKHCYYKNFFNDILEPLFYEALRNDRSHDDHYFSYFNCKIPFLNGGLFDPVNDYNWAKTDILLADTLFSNQVKTKEGDIGTGVLDVFDRYNFTVKEDEPLEKEVAVDPEMLGKVFENLLEVKDRKSKGTYYTPREIVHYMCQQSLINYLYTEVNGKQESRTKEEKIQMKLLGKPDPIQQNLSIEKALNIICKEDIEKLIKYGDTTIENDNHVATKGEETKTYSFKLPENIRKNAERIDEALKNIHVCDPAIGSGAFPVGMMNEIIRARNVLTPYLSLREAEAMKQSRTMYNFKRHAIQNCLYGVDIDPGAVEIAKLRLWLSLIVDEEDINKIKPLPNLDYKIMQGNSLISEFMGIDLDNDKQNNKKEKLFFTNESNELYEMLKVKKDELLNQPNINNKKILKKEIENLIIKIFEVKLQEQKSDYFKKIREIEEKWERHPVKEERESAIKIEKDILSIKTGFNLEEAEKQLRQYTSNQKIRPFFPWKLYFSEVFQEKDGFDVVIANPPYGANIDKMIKIYAKLYPNTTKAFKDIYKIFIELGMSKLIARKGVLCYILPNTLLLQPRYKDARKFLLDFKIVEILNLGEGVFEQVVVPICIIFIQNDNNKSNILKFRDLSNKSKFKNSLNNINYKIIEQKNYNNTPDNIFIYKTRKLSKDEILLGEIMNLKDCGIKYQRIKIGLSQKGKSDLAERIFYKGNKKHKEDKKVLIGKNLDRKGWYINFSNTYYLRHNYKDLLKENEIVYFNETFFNKNEKIIWRQTSSFFIGSLLAKPIWFANTLQAGEVKNEFKSQYLIKYILALLNSKYLHYIYNFIVKEEGRVFPQIKLSKLKYLPIKKISLSKQKDFINIVDKILSLTQSTEYLQDESRQKRVKEYAQQINKMVYTLYGLTGEEISIVENFCK